MKAAGIICEFNPLHNGHKYILDSIRRDLSLDAVVCVMSGDLVQRGGPAVMDKFQRARCAVTCGADLVLELPAYHAGQGAREFALGGVRILQGLGCVDFLCFGSESGSSDDLRRTAEKLVSSSDLIDERISSHLAEGVSYPAAYEAACGDLGISIPTLPNDILALEYMKASLSIGADWSFHAVKRAGAGHDSREICGSIASASAVRELILSGNVEDWKGLVPACTVLAAEQGGKLGAEEMRRYFDLARFLLLTSSSERLADLPEAREGIGNRLKEAARTAQDLDSLIKAAKTRRYTYAGISRIIAQLVFGLSKSAYQKIRDEGQRYAKVLAIGEKGPEILAFAGKAGLMPVISNVNKIADDFPCRELLDADLNASDVYNLIRGRDISACSDRRRIPAPER